MVLLLVRSPILFCDLSVDLLTPDVLAKLCVISLVCVFECRFVSVESFFKCVLCQADVYVSLELLSYVVTVAWQIIDSLRHWPFRGHLFGTDSRDTL